MSKNNQKSSNDYDPGSWTSRPYCAQDLENSAFCNRAFFGDICGPGFICDSGANEMTSCPENKGCFALYSIKKMNVMITNF